MCRFASGTLYHYPKFNAGSQEDALKFGHELSSLLSRRLGLEAVLRVRASQGIRISEFFGHFFARAQDLLSIPNVSPEHSYAVQLVVEENLQGPIACFQTALLHTTDSEERRIRVVTTTLPITANLSELYGAVDQGALATMIAKMAIEKAIALKLEDARDAVVHKCIDLLTTYRQNFGNSGGGGMGTLTAPECMKMLPVMLLGLLRHVNFISFVDI